MSTQNEKISIFNIIMKNIKNKKVKMDINVDTNVKYRYLIL